MLSLEREISTILFHYIFLSGLEKIFFDLITLDTLVYDINKEGVTLKELEQMTVPETCHALMSMVSFCLPAKTLKASAFIACGITASGVQLS